MTSQLHGDDSIIVPTAKAPILQYLDDAQKIRSLSLKK